MNNRDGSALLAVLALVAVSIFGAVALALTQTSKTALLAIRDAPSSHYAAMSGLEWFLQTVKGKTTADRAFIEGLDGTSLNVSGYADGPAFTLAVAYADPDGDPATADTVTVASEGAAGSQTSTPSKRTMKITVTIPPPGAPYFSDNFDQSDTSAADAAYHAGTTATAHGLITPFTTLQNMPDGDTGAAVTHSSEAGGATGVIKISGQNETRMMISAGECFKWSVNGGACATTQCVSDFNCQARQGMNIPADANGYQNYFIKLRVRLVSSLGGFGVYFRASYPNQPDPIAVDLGGLSGYIWQYDPNVGYIAPCDVSTAVFGNDGMGMFFGRRIYLGSETCGAECAIFSAFNPLPSPETYPFFCPENRTGLSQLDGWRWANADWLNKWRTVYIYVFGDMAHIYVGREEITGPGSETDPTPVGTLLLDSIGAGFKTGDIGARVWGGGATEIDYIMIFPNDANYTPELFAG